MDGKCKDYARNTWDTYSTCLIIEGICMTYEWNMYDICMEYEWNLYEICKECLWEMYGI